MDKVIEGCPDDTSHVETEEGVNNEDGNEKETENEYEGVTYIYITESGKETNRDNLDKVIE